MAKPNIKSLVSSHFEKGLFAIACLVALGAIFGSKWIPYGHHPSEITKKVTEADQKIAVKTWPKEEAVANFTVPAGESVEELVAKNIRLQVDPTPFEFDVSFSPGLYDTTKPITEPEFVGIGALIADSGRFLMGVQPKQEFYDPLQDPLAKDEEDKKEEEEDPEADIPEEFRSRSNVTPGGMAGMGTAGMGMDPAMMMEMGMGMGGVGGVDPGMGMLGRMGMGMGMGGSERGGKGRRGGEDMAAMGMGGMPGAGGLPGMEGMSEADMGAMGMGMGGMGMGMQTEGRGLRFVAVRGIIPLREQIRKYMKSLHVRFPQAANLYEIIEFELERKKAQPGDDPWSGDWQTVDIDIAKDILSEALSFDPDVVQSSITDSAVTMPLPGRLMGVWKTLATHPQLENFTLSEEEIEKEAAFNRLMLKEYEEQKDAMPEQLVSKGGFSDIVYDGRSMQMGAFNMQHTGGGVEEFNYEEDARGGRGRGMAGSMGMGMGAGMGAGMGMGMDPAMMGAGGGMGMDPAMAMGGMGAGADMGMGMDPGMMMGINYAPTSQGATTREAQEFIKKYEKIVEENADDAGKQKDEAIMEYIKKRITAQGELLLFRYLDFDVEPGATYKYRARLVVRNPNFGLPVAQVAGLAHIVEGQTRKSDWSNDTEPVMVPPDVDYFVAKIEDKGAGLTDATMAVFQWNPDFGTTIFDSLKIGLGEEIGGPKETLVLDPAKNRFEAESYTFHTGDVLVDALPEDKITRTEHPDLELPRSARGELGISGQVLISQGNGHLAVIDHLSRIPDLKLRRQYLKYERDPYADIQNRESKQSDQNDLESMYGEYGAGADAMGMDPAMMGMMGGMLGGSEEDFGRGRRRGRGLRKPSGQGGFGQMQMPGGGRRGGGDRR